MLHIVRVHQPTSWAHIPESGLRDTLEASSREQVGHYVVASGLTMAEADFLGGTMAVLAVVDDFGALVRVA